MREAITTNQSCSLGESEAKDCPEISIVIPSFKRPRDLDRCLQAVRRQEHKDFECIVVCRACDENTQSVARKFGELDVRFQVVIVSAEGVVAAMNRGLDAARGEYVSFTDDDAEAPDHWLKTIISHFKNHPNCGGVGGPDRLQLEAEEYKNPSVVSKVGRFGRLGNFHGNHHCRIMHSYVESDVLKGVNMTFRRRLISGRSIGDGLRGRGAQVGHEHSLSHYITSQNFALHFVSELWVLHHTAPRRDSDDRVANMTQFALDSTYNRCYVVVRYRTCDIWIPSIARTLLVGSKRVPGLLRCGLSLERYQVAFAHLPHVLLAVFAAISAKVRR